MGRCLSTALAVFAIAVSAAPAVGVAAPPPLPSRELLLGDQADFRALTTDGLDQTDGLWWKPELGFYGARSDGSGAEPTPYLWWAFPLFEAKAAAALAQPTAANKAALSVFALRAEKYWDPTAAG